MSRQRGSVYRVKGGYGIRWREPDGSWGTRGRPPFSTKTEARRWWQENVAPGLDGGVLFADRRMTLGAFTARYLRLHAATHEPGTVRTLRWRLERYALPVFGDVPLVELEPMALAIAEWREMIPERSRYGVVSALRQVLNAAVRFGLIRTNPAAKAGRNPQPRPPELRPFTLDDVDALDVELGPAYGPLVVFAAETGLRPSEWIALERRDVHDGVVVVERVFRDGAIRAYGKTSGARRRLPLTARAAGALDRLPARIDTRLLFPAPSGCHLDLHNWRSREWYPALDAAGLARRGPYALRHTFATAALAAGLGTFELSRYMGTSVLMIERHYGHLAAGSEEHARARLDAHAARLCNERATSAAADQAP